MKNYVRKVNFKLIRMKRELVNWKMMVYQEYGRKRQNDKQKKRAETRKTE